MVQSVEETDSTRTIENLSINQNLTLTSDANEISEDDQSIVDESIEEAEEDVEAPPNDCEVVDSHFFESSNPNNMSIKVENEENNLKNVTSETSFDNLKSPSRMFSR